MTCRETREHLFAFLDNELDAPLSIELQRHLERCPECAREAEIERTVGKKLADRLCAKRSSGAIFAGSIWRGSWRYKTKSSTQTTRNRRYHLVSVRCRRHCKASRSSFASMSIS